MARSMKLRPRFSLSTLAILVTLVCAYFGAWEATKKYGVQQRWTRTQVSGVEISTVNDSDSPFPFYIKQRESVRYIVDANYLTRQFSSYRNRSYLWLFGIKIRLRDSGPSEEVIRRESKLPMPYAKDVPMSE